MLEIIKTHCTLLTQVSVVTVLLKVPQENAISCGSMTTHRKGAYYIEIEITILVLRKCVLNVETKFIEEGSSYPWVNIEYSTQIYMYRTIIDRKYVPPATAYTRVCCGCLPWLIPCEG